MSVLGALEPARVMHYFEEICGIPHGSGNTKKISDYCVSFAKEHHLTYLRMLLLYWRRMNIHTRRWRLCLR